MATEGVAGEVTLDNAAVQKHEVQVTLNFTPVRVRAVLLRNQRFLNLAELEPTISGTKITVPLNVRCRVGDKVCWQAYQS
jgi:tmRNA-binding protein